MKLRRLFHWRATYLATTTKVQLTDIASKLQPFMMSETCQTSWVSTCFHNVTANNTLSTLVCMHTVKQVNGRVVTMVAWFTVVVGANQSVSLLFPHSGIRKRGEKNKETTPLVVIASV